MGVWLTEPSSEAAGLDDLGALWMELHGHHRDVATYPDPVEDLDVSWERRRSWYRRLLGQGAAYIVARDGGTDTVRIAVMAGNARAELFSESQGHAVAEHLLYRRLGGDG
jgi:hypothetical protein